MIFSAPTAPDPTIIRVFLVEDHPIVLRALGELLEDEPDVELCGKARSVDGAVDAIEEARPDVVVVDMQLDNSHGDELLQHLHDRWVGVRALVLSHLSPSLFAERARKAGAHGYVCKSDDPAKIIDAVRRVYGGETYFEDASGKS